MPLSKLFYWLFSGTLLILLIMLGYGGVILYKTENKKVQEEIGYVVEKSAKKVQDEDYGMYNIVKALTDKDFKEKMAFAAGITQNQARISMDFDKQQTPEKPGNSARKHDSIEVTILPKGEKPMKMTYSTKPSDTSKIPYAPHALKNIGYFDSLLRATLTKENLAVPFTIEKIAAHATPPAHYASGMFIINFYDPVLYRVNYNIPGFLIMRRLLPFTGVSLLLLLMISAAFFLYHKSYRTQMQMAQFKESLFSNVTHELKTPLSSLQIIISSFKDSDSGLSQKQREYIDFAGKW